MPTRTISLLNPFTILISPVLVCVAFNLSAAQSTHFVFDGGIIDAKRNLVYVTSTGGSVAPAGIVHHHHDGRGAHYVAHESSAAITALRLNSGKKVWTTKGVLVPMHLFKNKLVSYAVHEKQVILAVLDVRNGKILKRLETEIHAGKPKNEGCCPSNHQYSKWRGEEKDFWYTFQWTSCPKRSPSGVHMSDDEIALNASECSHSDYTVRLNLSTLEMNKVEEARPTGPHQTGTESRHDLGDVIVRAETRCVKGSYYCREKTLTLKYYQKDGKTLIRETVLIEKSNLQTSRLSADGKYVFVPMPGGKETRDLRIFRSHTGKELRKKPYKIPTKYNFTAYLLLKGTLIGTDSEGTSGLRLRDLKRLWHISRPSVMGPPCPDVP